MYSINIQEEAARAITNAYNISDVAVDVGSARTFLFLSKHFLWFIIILGLHIFSNSL